MKDSLSQSLSVQLSMYKQARQAAPMGVCSCLEVRKIKYVQLHLPAEECMIKLHTQKKG